MKKDQLMLICTKAIFIFFKVIHFYTKTILWKLAKKYKPAKMSKKLKYKIDIGICTERLIAIA